MRTTLSLPLRGRNKLRCSSLPPRQPLFSVERDNPFEIFPLLQKIARESVGAESVIDLSRGDPGYGFSPSVAGREFFGYLIMLDAFLNSWERKFSPSEKIWDEIVLWTQGAFPERSRWFLNQWEKFFDAFRVAAHASRLDVLSAIFLHSIVSGGTYLDPAGEPLFRAFIAWYHQQHIQTPINGEDVIFFQGASHAAGTVFKALGVEGKGYLSPGDTVLISSPVYNPYNLILEHRGIRVVSLSLDPLTGAVSPASLDCVFASKVPLKMIVLIDPNNPIGISGDPSLLHKIADLARLHDSIILTDEVYSDFFPPKTSLIDLCPERVIRIHARSKIERSTGLRFGDAVITQKAQQYLGQRFGVDFMRLLINAKAPGGVHGEFYHTAFVSGPAQVLGLCHMILGAEDRQRALSSLRESRDRFFSVLGLPHHDNMYYALFDFHAVPGCVLQDVSVEEKLLELARRGVVYIPAYRFFDEKDRGGGGGGGGGDGDGGQTGDGGGGKGGDFLNMMRVSFVNAPPSSIERAAQITKDYLQNRGKIAY